MHSRARLVMSGLVAATGVMMSITTAGQGEPGQGSENVAEVAALPGATSGDPARLSQPATHCDSCGSSIMLVGPASESGDTASDADASKRDFASATRELTEAPSQMPLSSAPLVVSDESGAIATYTIPAFEASQEAIPAPLPLGSAPPAIPVAPLGCETILNETFEGVFPSGSWTVQGNPTWDDDDYKPYQGSWSAWCANGGSLGLDPASSNYPNNMNAWMIWGPFSLAGAQSGNLSFYYWLDSESNYDYFKWYTSIDGSMFYGYRTSGNSGGWISKTLDFSSVPTLGNILGQSSVWIAFKFDSDVSNTYKGAFVDNVQVQRCTTSTPDLIAQTVYFRDQPGNAGNIVDTPCVGQAVYPHFTFQVSGSSVSGKICALDMDGTQLCYYSGTADPGSWVVWCNSAWTATSGSHTLRGKLDPDGTIPESNESNNQATKTFTSCPSPDGEIHGAKWNDLDGDANWDAGEPGMGSWKIYLDTNNNCQWDNGEPYHMSSAANGSYAFTGLAPGTYTVAEVLQSGWGQTFPVAAAGSQGGPTTLGDMLTAEQLAAITRMAMDSPSQPPPGIEGTIVTALPESAVMLNEVPTSTWTYGCSPTSAGMMFGYYDRHEYPNMYAGPTNGGVAPLTDLGQGDEPAHPIPGSCSIIATQNGFDGRTSRGHVDDYWISYGSPGPDPWEGHWTQHTWGECTADYMGTNQWKWDFFPWPGGNGAKDSNTDGATSLFSDGTSRLYDFVPPASCGLPQTELCHGMRLFVESRGYTVTENYTQGIGSGGFTFADYMGEIDAGRPAMIQVTGHSMVGVGYDSATQTVYIHDTWDNNVHSMTWGGKYATLQHEFVTVIHLVPICSDRRHTVTLSAGQIVSNINFGNRVGPEVIGAVSRKTHTGVGHFDIDILASGAVESRTLSSSPPAAKAVVTFDQPVVACDGTLNAGDEVTVNVGAISGLTLVGAELTIDIDLTSVPLPAQLVITLDGFCSVGLLPGSPSVLSVCLLEGDVNADAVVNIEDLQAVKRNLFQPVTAANFRADVNHDGDINIVDLQQVKFKLFTLCP